MKKLVYDTSTGLVENIVICDGSFTLTGKTLVTYTGQAEIGYTWNGSTFDAPAAYVYTWDDVNLLQSQMLDVTTEVLWRISRYKEQTEMTSQTTTETAASYQLLLDYRQDVRNNDIDLNATPDLAITALEALTIPEPIYT